MKPSHRAVFDQARMMAAIALAMHPQPAVARCDPATDDRTLIDHTGYCKRCGNRLTYDQLMQPLPECKGVEAK